MNDEELKILENSPIYKLGKAAGRTEAIAEVREKITETYLQCGQAGQVFGINDVRRVFDEMEGYENN